MCNTEVARVDHPDLTLLCEVVFAVFVTMLAHSSLLMSAIYSFNSRTFKLCRFRTFSTEHVMSASKAAPSVLSERSERLRKIYRSCVFFHVGIKSEQCCRPISHFDLKKMAGTKVYVRECTRKCRHGSPSILHVSQQNQGGQ